MLNNKVLLLCVGLGAIVVLGWSWWWFRDDAEHLDPPDVLLERILQAPSAETQAQAARDMVRHGPAAKPFVHRALAEYKGNDTEVMVALLEAVQKQRDWEHIPRLFALMEHDDPRVRARAASAITAVMGADYGFSADAPPEQRREALKRIRAIHKQMQPALEQFYRSQENKEPLP